VLSSGANSFEMRIMTDNDGKPGSVLETITFTDQMDPWTDPSISPVLGASLLNPVLYSGVDYWAIAYAGGTTEAQWYFSNASLSCLQAVNPSSAASALN